jgi:hypothetical protein
MATITITWDTQPGVKPGWVFDFRALGGPSRIPPAPWFYHGVGMDASWAELREVLMDTLQWEGIKVPDFSSLIIEIIRPNGKETRTFRKVSCPACSHPENDLLPWKGEGEIYVCRACGAVHGSLRLEDSYKLVKDEWVGHECPPEEMRYYDLLCTSSEGLVRRHGWFCFRTRQIVQVG